MPGGSALEIGSSSLSGSMQHTASNSAPGCKTTYEFLHLAAASALRWSTGQFPWWKMGALRLRPNRMVVAAERCTEYTALSIGCKARLAFLTALGVTARFTVRPGCTARRTLRGTNSLEKKPIFYPQATKPAALEDYSYTHACAGMVCWPDMLAARRIRDAAVSHQTAADLPAGHGPAPARPSRTRTDGGRRVRRSDASDPT